MVFYFTATGNSLYVARQFSEAPVSIPQIMRGSQRRFSDSTIGIVCPVFAGQPPKMVVRFLEESEFETEYFYMILTYGHDESDSPEFTARLAEKHGIFVDYIAAIKMVDNYLPVFDMTEETALNKHIEEQMEAAVRAVSERRHSVPKATKEQRALHAHVAEMNRQMPDFNNGSQITVKENCVGCGICGKVCPIGNFYVEDGQAKRRQETCEFCLACVHKLIPVNLAEGIDLPKSMDVKPYHTRNIDTQKTLTMEQMQVLLEASRETPIHMQVLFNVLMGLRRQEINGLKYSDIDYINRTLSVERQLGKELDRTPNAADDRSKTKKELPLKTSSSKRELPIPDYVFEAILEERKIYERNRSRRESQFLNLDYICCSNYGKPRSKDFHWRHYKELLKSTGLPDIRWHDLRSTFCTLLLKSDFNPKAVSKLMGHAKELITLDVYGDNFNIIPEELPELLSYMEDVVLKKESQKSMASNVLDIVIDVGEYLTKTGSD